MKNTTKQNSVKSAEQVRLNTLDEQTIIKSAQQDLDAYNKGEKSFEVMNYLKEELIINGYDEQTHYLKCSPKALNRIINPLSYLRQNLLSELVINILDTQTSVIKFKVDMSTVSNGYRRILNQNYGLNIEEITTTQAEYDELAMMQF